MIYSLVQLIYLTLWPFILHMTAQSQKSIYIVSRGENYYVSHTIAFFTNFPDIAAYRHLGIHQFNILAKCNKIGSKIVKMLKSVVFLLAQLVFWSAKCGEFWSQYVAKLLTSAHTSLWVQRNSHDVQRKRKRRHS